MDPQPARRRHPTRMLVALLPLLGACVRYQARPVDPALVLQAWQDLRPAAATAAVNEVLAGGAGRPGGFDLADGIVLAEAETAALFFNPSIRVARLEAGIPEATARHALLWEDPELAVDGAVILEDVAEPLILGGSLGITIPLSGRRAVARRLARDEVAASELAVLGAEWALRATVRREWARLALLGARSDLQRQALAEITGLIALVPRLRAAQVLTVVDERLFEIQRLRTGEALRQTSADLVEQRLVLLAALGLHPDHPWELQASLADFAPDPSAADGHPPADVLHHPQLRAVMAAYQVSERRLELAVREQYPDLRLGLGLGVEDGAARLLLGGGLLPLPVWNRNRQDIAVAGAERTVAAARIEVAVQELAVRIERLRSERRRNQTHLAFLREQLAPLLDRQVADARRLSALGQLDPFQLVEAMDRLQAFRLELLDAQGAGIATAIALTAAQGPDLPRTLDDAAAAAPGDG